MPKVPIRNTKRKILMFTVCYLGSSFRVLQGEELVPGLKLPVIAMQSNKFISRVFVSYVYLV